MGALLARRFRSECASGHNILELIEDKNAVAGAILAHKSVPLAGHAALLARRLHYINGCMAVESASWQGLVCPISKP